MSKLFLMTVENPGPALAIAHLNLIVAAAGRTAFEGGPHPQKNSPH
jgi:hypothetical protein